MFPNVERDPHVERDPPGVVSAAYVVRTGSVTPKAPAFWGPKKRPMILALWPPVRAIPIGARERYDNVLTRVPVRDGRGVTRFVRSRANQRRDRECKNSLPHDVPPFLLILFRRPGSFSLSGLPWALRIIKQPNLFPSTDQGGGKRLMLGIAFTGRLACVSLRIRTGRSRRGQDAD